MNIAWMIAAGPDFGNPLQSSGARLGEEIHAHTGLQQIGDVGHAGIVRSVGECDQVEMSRNSFASERCGKVVRLHRAAIRGILPSVEKPEIGSGGETAEISLGSRDPHLYP